MALSLDGTTGISATGNIISSGGIISATGNIYGGNIIGTIAPSAITVSGNATVGNLLTGGLISATGNILAGNIIVIGGFYDTGDHLVTSLAANANIVLTPTGTGTTQNNGAFSASGNVTGSNILTGGLMSSTGNAIHGNILTAGVVSATGNVNANFFIGNGAALTGLSASKIFNGTSEANIGTSGGNANITIGGTSNVFVVASTGIYTTGLSSVSGNVTSGNFLTGGLISATSTITSAANITGGNLLTGGLISAASTVTGTSFLGTVTSVTANVTGGNLLTGGLISAASTVTGTSFLGTVTSVTGNITGANVIITGTAAAGSGVLIVSGNIQTSTSNATANIGNASNYFNRLFAQATTALYADLAEVYKADAQYPPGTVLVFGGTQEVTMSTESHDVKIAGVVSTHPAHVMNSGLQSEFTVEVGLIGRVPCRVIGPISAGDRVVSSNRAGVAERLDMSKYQPGVIIGKALESYSDTNIGTIEVVVGRL